MKEFFDSVSHKTKYFLFISFLLILVFVLVYTTFIHSSSDITRYMLRILIFSEMFVILFMGSIVYRLIKSDSTYCSTSKKIKDDIFDSSMIFNAISEGIIVIDNKGRVRKINQFLCQILEAEENPIINKNVYSLFNEWNYNDERKSLILLLIESLETHKECRENEIMVFINSKPCFFSVFTYILRNENKDVTGVLAVVHDCTQSKKLEEHLSHLEKLASAGQIAAELAHEIKNPICSIKGLVQLMGKKYSLEGSKHYEVITNEINKINALTQGFLTLTRKRPVFAKTCISKIIEEMIPLIESNAKGKKIYVGVDMQKEMPFIFVDRESIKQVIMNIVQNGIDALNENERINICIWYDQINELVKMEFKDNGGGIKPEYLDKIFEPFFTTKESGTGLGLAISRKIIESHYGKLFAINNLERGATFIIELPASIRYVINDDRVS